MQYDRIRQPEFIKKMKTGEEDARILKSGMTVGMSGFTRAGDAKAMPLALAERARREALQLTLIAGVSLGNGSDGPMTSARLLARRLPFKGDATLHRKINDGEVMFIDQHLSKTAKQLRSYSLAPVDTAVIEAEAITEDGSIVATMAVGNSASFVQQACSVTIEIKLSAPRELEGLHGIYLRAAGSGPASSGPCAEAFISRICSSEPFPGIAGISPKNDAQILSAGGPTCRYLMPLAHWQPQIPTWQSSRRTCAGCATRHFPSNRFSKRYRGLSFQP